MEVEHGKFSGSKKKNRKPGDVIIDYFVVVDSYNVRPKVWHYFLGTHVEFGASLRIM